ncbi:14289_t:CDS:2 [Funneliformis mosseae]|uniref:14289_t:CDS:1 n=1 Tax=Funneliformis mosseae TaxID=27381 RepID=A0A9N9AZA5_FUNMO|nr:14289_t:CDS:2 [Funneliformis mosseae]
MLDVLCLCLSHNLAPMAVLAKEQPRPVDKKNINIVKQAECTAAWKSGYYARPQGRLPKHDDKNHFKNGRRQCRKIKELLVTKEGTEQKNQETPQFENGKVPPIMKYDQKISTSYTPITLIVHVLIICQHLYLLYITSPTWIRFASFTQLVYFTTTCFHIAMLLANVFKKTQLERAFVLYGTWIIWMGWAMCLWFVRSEDRPDSILFRSLTSDEEDMSELEYLLAPMDVAPFLMHGKWSTTTLPIFSFFLLLVIRRNHWGLIVWEHLVLLDYSRNLKWYRSWCVGTGAGWMLTWEAARIWLQIPLSFPNSEGSIVFYKTDLPSFPGLFNVLIASVIAGIFMMCWWSFWTFQYRGVIWKKEFKEGVVVWLSDGWMRVGGIGC